MDILRRFGYTTMKTVNVLIETRFNRVPHWVQYEIYAFSPRMLGCGDEVTITRN